MSTENKNTKDDHQMTDVSLLIRMLAETKRHWVGVGILFVISLVSTPLALLAPLPLKVAVDNVINGEPLPPYLVAFLPESMHEGSALLLAVIIAVVVIALLSGIQKMVATLYHTHLSEKMMLGFRARIFR